MNIDEEVEKYLIHIKSDKYLKQKKENLIIQMIEFLNQEYKNSITTLDFETEMINILGTDKEKIMSELKDFGLISK